MSTNHIAEDFREIALSVLSSAIDTISHNAEDLDIVAHRLESLLDAINLVTQTTHLSWGNVVVALVTQAVGILLLDSPARFFNHARPGRPKLEIPVNVIENLLSMNFKVPTIATILGASKRTVFQRMSEAGLSVSATYTTISDVELDRIILEILLQHPNTGYKRMKGYLCLRNIKVTNTRIRESLRTVDPVGAYQRTLQNRAIIRRQYFVEYSNQLWHLDTNMKLIRWSIIIRSCVDGKSRTVIYINASGDNRSETNFSAFMTGVEKFGVPLRTRSDKGGENVLIARFMIEARGTGRASHIAGRSVHNQRIERFWRDVFYGVTGFYYSVFSKMEDDGSLNIENPVHMSILHKIFLPRMCYHLDIFSQAWNCHPISTEGNLTPRQLMLLHLPPPEMDLQFSEASMTNSDIVCNDLDDLASFDPPDSITNPSDNDTIIPDPVLRYINTLEPSQISNSYGYELFQNAIQLLQQ